MTDAQNTPTMIGKTYQMAHMGRRFGAYTVTEIIGDSAKVRDGEGREFSVKVADLLINPRTLDPW